MYLADASYFYLNSGHLDKTELENKKASMVCHIYLVSLSSRTSDLMVNPNQAGDRNGIIWDGKDFGGHLVQPLAQSRAQIWALFNKF